MKKLLSFIVTGIGFSVCLSWILTNNDVLTASGVTMKFGTAVMFMVAGIGLIVRNHSVKAHIASVMCGFTIQGIIFYICYSLSVQHSFISFADADNIQTVVSGLPSFGTLLAFFAFSGSMLFNDRTLIRASGWICTIIAFVSLMGYFMHAPEFYYYFEDHSTAMAFNTAVLFAILGYKNITVEE